MINKPCVKCKKPMNGGVYRKPNQCPHCFALQDTTRSADNKRKVTLEEALKAKGFSRRPPVAGTKTAATKKASVKPIATATKTVKARPKTAETAKRRASTQI